MRLIEFWFGKRLGYLLALGTRLGGLRNLTSLALQALDDPFEEEEEEEKESLSSKRLGCLDCGEVG